MKKIWIVGIVVMSLLMVGCNQKESKTNEIKDISFNGMKLGDKATEKTLEGLVMDAPFKYEFNNVGFNVDSEQKIDYLRVTTYKDSDGNVTQGMDDIEIKHKNTRLKTVDDFKKLFGEGETSKDNQSILYEDKENEIVLYIHLNDDKITSIELEKINTIKKDKN